MFDDANLEQAEAGVLAGIFAAAGQTCVAGSRAYLHEKIYDAFVDRLVKRATQITRGDPLKLTTQMGPVATKLQLEQDESMVPRAVTEGAAVLCGGRRPQLAEFPNGYFYEPTIVHQASRDSFLMRNEVFGPVLAVTPFKDDGEALALANDTDLGSLRASGQEMYAASTSWRVSSKRARYGSIPTAHSRSIRLSAATRSAASDGRTASKRSISACRPRASWCELGDEVQDPFVMKV